MAGGQNLDDDFRDFVEAEEVATRTTIAGWRRRLDALAAFFPHGIEAGPALVDNGMRLDALFWMAEVLVWQGFPGRALSAFAQHDALCRSMGAAQSQRLASALAQHGDALRQCGRLHDADLVTRNGLDLQRRVGHPFTLAIHLFQFGLGLAMRGETTESTAALDEATTMLRREATSGGDVADSSLLLAQRAMWELDFDGARHAAVASAAGAQSTDEVGRGRVLATTTRISGEIALARGEFVDAHELLSTSLRLADDVSLVDEVVRSLIGLATATLALDHFDETRRWIDAIFPIVHQGPYHLHDVDAHLLLADLEGRLGNSAVAQQAAARAKSLSVCDGPPFSYVRGQSGGAASRTFGH